MLDRFRPSPATAGGLALVVLAAVVGLWISNASAIPCSKSYSGSGDWSDTTKWSGGTLPSSTDIACWNSTDTVTVSTAGMVADSVHGGTLSMTGGSLALTGATNSTLSGLTISGGHLDGGSSTITLSGDFDWNVANGGSSAIGAGNAVTIDQTGTHNFTIEGQGTESFTRGSLMTPNPVTVSNTAFSPGGAGGSSITTTDNITFAPGTYSGNTLDITAKGIKTTGAVNAKYSLHLTGTGTPSPSSLGGDLTLTGLDMGAGTVLTIPSNTVLTAGSGTISGTVTGNGTYTHDGASAEIASGGTLSPANVTVSDQVAPGTLTLDSGGTYAPSGLTKITGGSVVLNNDASTGGLQFTAGHLGGAATKTFTDAGDFDWNPPTGKTAGINDGNPQSLTIAQTGSHNFTIEGAGTPAIGDGSLTTPNPVVISNTNFDPNSFGPSLTTQSTTTFTHAGTYVGSSLHLVTAGLITAPGATTLPYDVHLTGGTTSIGSGNPLTADQVTVSGGTLNVGGTLTAPTDVTGGTLKGTGTVDASVTNGGGTLAPGSSPGTMTITGDYTQGPGGTLAEEITGTNPATQFDRLLVEGALALDGTLAIDSHSFTPGLHDTFKIISGATSRTGTFAHVTGATVNGDTYTPQYDADGVTLTITGPDRSSPSILITTPVAGAHYKQGQKVLAAYSCGDPEGATDITLCQGPAPNGKPIDTSTAGDHTFTVQASDKARNTSSKTVHYTVDTTESSPPTVHGFPPDQGCVPGKLKLKVSVHPTRLRRASVFLDGKLVASSTKHDFKVTISGSQLRPGRHTIKILREYKSGTKRRSTFSFTRCKKGGKSPHIHTEGTPDRGSCTAKPFSMFVSITRVDVKTIRVTLDGKPFAKPGQAKFTLGVNIAKLKRGAHRMTITAADKHKNSSVSVTDFVRC